MISFLKKLIPRQLKNFLIKIINLTVYDRFFLLRERFWVKKLESSKFLHKAKENPPLVSIVMPTKNRKDMIRNAIYSVLGQSYVNWELLIIDDGSTDGTLDFLKSNFQDKRIKIFNSNGVGVSGTRNLGLKASKGDIIAYLDSDNSWSKNYLLFSVAKLLENDLHLHYSGMKVCTGEPGSKPKNHILYKRFYFENLIKKNFIDLNVFTHGKKVYDDLGGFDTSLKRLVDWDLIITYCTKYTITSSPFIGAIYDNTKRADRITHSEDFLKAKFAVWKKHQYFPPRKNP